jgi:Ca2+-binding RTX toxin-like protein
MGDGDDLVQCVAMTVLAGNGADSVHGVADGSTVQAGPGADFVAGDLDADVVSLGGGDDTGNVVNGSVDEVYGGAGTDVVKASSNDLLFSAQRASASGAAQVVRPKASVTRQRCRSGAAVRTVRLNNRGSTVAVGYTLAKRVHGHTVRDSVRVAAGGARAKVLRVRAQRVARVTVRAAGDRLLTTRINGRRC